MLIVYKCFGCQATIKKIVYKKEDIVGVLPCLDCGAFFERIIQGPTSNSVETIDNGAMPNKVEFDQQRNDLRKDASDKFFKEKAKE